MKKELPRIYVNNIDKAIDNNKKIYISNIATKTEAKQKTDEDKNLDEVKKIVKKMFNKKDLIYKIPVEIETNNEKLKTKIIGKKDNYLITIENKIINIKEIKNIKYKKENE